MLQLSFRYIRTLIVSYIILILIVGIFLPTASTSWHTLYQLVLAISTLSLLYVVQTKGFNEIHLFGGVFFATLLGAFSIQALNLSLYSHYFGKTASDALFYQELATHYANRAYSDLLDFLSDTGWGIDDLGFPLVKTTIYSLAGSEQGETMMLFLNSFLIAWGSVWLSRVLYSFLENRSWALWGGLLWGMSAFGIFVSAVGLKENVFAFLVIMAFYGYTLWTRHQSFFKGGLLFGLGCLGVALFRLPVFYMMGIFLGSYFFLRLPNARRYLLYLGGITLVAAYFLKDSIIAYSYQQKGYDDAGIMLQGVQDKLLSTGNFYVSNLTNTLAAIVGPFPNLHSTNADKASYITLFSLGSFLKCYLSFFFIFGVYHIIKQRILALLPFVIFLACHIFMLIVTFYSLDDRMHWPHIPIYYLIVFWGMKHYWYSSRNRTYIQYYAVAITALILIFNLR